MKRLIIEISIAILLFTGAVLAVRYGNHQKAEKERQASNFASSRRAPGKTTTEFDLSKKEFKTLFPVEYGQLDSLKRLKSGKQVQSFQKIVYKYSVDTVLIPVDHFVDSNNMVKNYQYSTGCLNALITTSESDSIELKLSGEVPLFIIVDLYRPKHWFWKLQWNKFNDSTRIETPCGLTIKENVKFNFK